MSQKLHKAPASGRPAKPGPGPAPAPAKGAKPGKPAKGATPGKPAKGAKPGKPPNGATPGKPTKGAAPSKPPKGATPGKPAKGATPGKPAKRAAPSKPAKRAAPSNQGTPPPPAPAAASGPPPARAKSVPPRHALPEGTVPALSTDAVPLVDSRPTLREVLEARGMPAAEMRTALETGKIWVLDAPTAMGNRQVDPEEVTVRMDAPRSIVGRDVVFVYADAHLAIVCKPPGMLAVPAPGRRGETSVISAVSKRYGKALPVHRLDEQTSGLMIVALSDEARAALIDDVSDHRIERIYLAIAAGKPNFDSRRVETLIARDRGDGRRGTVRHDDPDAMRAVTHLKVLERYERAALVEAQLETGRTHQIRIHLSELRLPLLGDPIYAPVAIRGLAPRLALHSARLGLTHPITGRRLQFYTELPDDLERVRLRLAREIADRPKPPKAPR